MNKYFIAILIFLLTGFVLWRFSSKSTDLPKTDSGKVRVVASFYPLYYFAHEIGGEMATVVSLTPAGVEPHDYEPTAGDMNSVLKSDLLILMGNGFEAWADNLTRETVEFELNILEVSEGVSFAGDPHVWLSPVKSLLIVESIEAEFSKIDPDNKEIYRTNAENLSNKLMKLDERYRKELSLCKGRSFVTSHDAFGYLAGEYSLNQVSISGLSPDEEPSVSDLAKISDMAKKDGIKYIFFETLVSPKLSETVAAEIGARTLVLDPLEGIDEERLQAGENYFTIMESNLNNLKIALECE